LSAGSSVSASSFGGNVTGSVAGTAASTVVNTANNAASAASTAQGTANSAASAASTAQGTANSAVSAASTAQTTANNAASAASTAQSTANAAASAASAAQSAADAKLARAGAQVLTGPVTLNAASAITVGNPALNGQPGFNGFYIGSTGIVGTQNGLTTFALDNAGNATFKGNLTGASGTFGGNLAVGSSPAVSDTTMSGTGAIINSGGTFALGNATNNISFNGSNITLNGDVIATGNLKSNSVSNTLIDSFNGIKYLLVSHGNTWQPVANVSAFISNTGSTLLITCTGDQIVGIYSDENNTFVYPPAFRLVRNGVVLYSKPGGVPNMSVADKNPPPGNYNYVFEMQNPGFDGNYQIAFSAGINFPLLNVTELKR